MRTFFTVVFATILSMKMNAQEKLMDIFPLMNGKVTYTNIIKVDSLSKDEIYNRAKHWLAYNYDYFKIDNKDELVCQGQIHLWNSLIMQIITIKIKEGRYKYEITNFHIVEHSVSNGTSWDTDLPLEKFHSLLGEKAFKTNLANQIDALIESLEKAMVTKTTDNW